MLSFPGFPIQTHFRFQMSLPIEHSDYFVPYLNFKSPDNSVSFTLLKLLPLSQIISPVYWVDERADIDAEGLDKLKSMLVRSKLSPLLIPR